MTPRHRDQGHRDQGHRDQGRRDPDRADPPVTDPSPSDPIDEESPAAPLRRKQAAATGFATELAHLAGQIERQWVATLDGSDPEALHQLRVAMRRTRSVLRAADRILAPDTLARFSADWQWLAGLTGPTRDLDVFIGEWHRYVDDLPARTIAALLPVSEHLHRHRRVAFEALADELRSDRAHRVLDSWLAELDDIRAGRAPIGRRGQQRLVRVVDRRIGQAHKRLVKHGRAVGDTTPGAALHEVRKDAKRLRYLIECFEDILRTKPTKRFVSRLKELQDNLGAIQDGEVHAAQLRIIARELKREKSSKATTAAVVELGERIEALKAESGAEFARRFAAFDSKKTRRELDRVLGGA